MSVALITVLAVGTGVVVIVVAVAVVVLAGILSASMRGRRKRGVRAADTAHRELRDAQERADRAERDRDTAHKQSDREADSPR